jgi:hypothetical protein
LAELREAVKSQETEKRLSEVSLSETNKTGFTAEGIKKVRKFAQKLDDAQWSEFKEIMKSYKTVDLSTKGSDANMLSEQSDSELLSKEFGEKVDALRAEGKSYAEAVIEVRRSDDRFKQLR